MSHDCVFVIVVLVVGECLERVVVLRVALMDDRQASYDMRGRDVV